MAVAAGSGKGVNSMRYHRPFLLCVPSPAAIGVCGFDRGRRADRSIGKGVCVMKVVVWKSPKFLCGILKVLFGIKKERI